MTLLESLLAVLLALPRTPDAQPPIVYDARIETIAEAIEAEAQEVRWAWGPIEMAAGIATVWYHESRFDHRVHAGERHPRWTQDDMRARCMGQIHASGIVQPREWRALAGVDLDATRRCARATARILVTHARHCGVLRGPLTVLDRAKILRGYGSGSECRPNASSSKRAGAWARVVKKLRSRPAPSAYARAE